MPGKRRSIRLEDYDYSQEGAYFVTICARGGGCGKGKGASGSAKSVFGNIKNGEMTLNGMGRIINDSWKWLGEQYGGTETDEFTVMPNHLHGIICMNDTRMGVNPIKRKTLGRLIGAFKTVSTKQINAIRNTPGAGLWQRNFYEHVIRDEADLNRVREYIINNPAGWEKDEYYCT